MEIWLDTIDFDAIRDGVKTGTLYGVTTNPSILSGTTNVFGTICKILDVQPGPIAIQVTSKEPEQIIEEAKKIFAFSSRCIIKIPINRNGLIAISQLKKRQIPIIGTGILFPAQVLLASNLKADYIAPYFGHMADASQALKTMMEIVSNNGFSTKILAASLKEIDHVLYCATLGIQAITLKPNLYYKLLEDHSAVENFMQKFSADWSTAHGQLSIQDQLQLN